MNDRKRAWQLLHQEIRRRATNIDSDTANTQFGTVVREADSVVHLLKELAGFGAILALMNRNPGDLLTLADQIGLRVMREPDEPDDEDDD